MRGEVLVDSNVLAYAYDRSEPVKQRTAARLLDNLFDARWRRSRRRSASASTSFATGSRAADDRAGRPSPCSGSPPAIRGCCSRTSPPRNEVYTLAAWLKLSL